VKLAVDTNVLVRHLICDHPEQARAATEQIEAAERIFLSTVVLCETAWVLKRAYRYSDEQIARTISAVIQSRNVETDRASAEAGLEMLSRGGDFADGVIENEAVRANCDRLFTFDHTFQQLLGPALGETRNSH
jgi:predicted nucleic-acid-binding protein